MSNRLTKKQVEHMLSTLRSHSPDNWDPWRIHDEDVIDALEELLELRRVGDEVVAQMAAERGALRARVAELETSHAARLTPAQFARMEAAGWTPGEAAASEWLVGRAERCAALEAPGECASIHKLRALVYEAAREAYRVGICADALAGSGLARADAIAERLLTEARPGNRRDSGGPA